MKTPTFTRTFTVAKQKGANNQRASLIEPFVTRLNNSRVAGGYKPLTVGFIASKMSHIKVDELHAHYKMLDNSKNFSALWWWYNVPKKKV